VEFTLQDGGDTGGVVAAVFEFAEAFDQEGLGGVETDVTDDAAHRGSSKRGQGGSRGRKKKEERK
jgi:hypothetical protein